MDNDAFKSGKNTCFVKLLIFLSNIHLVFTTYSYLINEQNYSNYMNSLTDEINTRKRQIWISHYVCNEEQHKKMKVDDNSF